MTRFRTALAASVASALLLVASPARAEWFEASSDHFVIYGDQGEKSLAKFARQLEQYHAAMAFLIGQPKFVPSPSNRVTVYLVSSDEQVRRLMSSDRKANRFVGGFYVPRAGASVAVVPRLKSSGGPELDWSMVVLLHEYAHHFMYSGAGFPMPRWYGEGAAEFFASTKFSDDGSLSIGRPAMHRAGELFNAADVKAENLLDPELYEKRRAGKKDYDAFYGKSWLLYHFLTFEPARKGQLKAYLNGLVAGKSSRAAGEAAFGDLKVLEKDLDGYLQRPKMNAIGLKPQAVEPGPVKLRMLSAGEAAVMPLVTQSRVGVNREKAQAVVVKARELALQFPKEAAVLSELAEAENDAGNPDAALAAAEATLALAPSNVRAMEIKGEILFGKARETGDAKLYRAANATFVALNRQENDHPTPLIYYYRGFVARNIKPSELAVQGLEQAAALAPFDLGLRFELGMQLLRDGRSAEARANFAAVAYAIHGGPISDKAREVIERIDKEPTWRGEGLKPPEKEDKAE